MRLMRGHAPVVRLLRVQLPESPQVFCLRREAGGQRRGRGRVRGTGDKRRTNRAACWGNRKWGRKEMSGPGWKFFFFFFWCGRRRSVKPLACRRRHSLSPLNAEIYERRADVPPHLPILHHGFESGAAIMSPSGANQLHGIEMFEDSAHQMFTQ